MIEAIDGQADEPSGRFVRLPFIGDDLLAPLATDLTAGQFAQLGWLRFRVDDEPRAPLPPRRRAADGRRRVRDPRRRGERATLSMFAGARRRSRRARAGTFGAGCRRPRRLARR